MAGCDPPRSFPLSSVGGSEGPFLVCEKTLLEKEAGTLNGPHDEVADRSSQKSFCSSHVGCIHKIDGIS
jgi:hypothetical protein